MPSRAPNEQSSTLLLSVSVLLLCAAAQGSPALNADDFNALQRCSRQWQRNPGLWTDDDGAFVLDACNGGELGNSMGTPWTAPNPCTPASTGCVMECVEWNSTTYVSSLRLTRQHLRGPICNSLSKLMRLTSLDLSFNNLEGTLPLGFGSDKSLSTGLTQLTHMDIGTNNITGEIPESWAYLPLTWFRLSPNYWLCGTMWLGAIAIPEGKGSKPLEAAIVAGSGQIQTANASNPYLALVDGTNLGVDCSLVNRRLGGETSVGQLMWTAIVLGAIFFCATWCLHN